MVEPMFWEKVIIHFFWPFSGFFDPFNQLILGKTSLTIICTDYCSSRKKSEIVDSDGCISKKHQEKLLATIFFWKNVETNC